MWGKRRVTSNFRMQRFAESAFENKLDVLHILSQLCHCTWLNSMFADKGKEHSEPWKGVHRMTRYMALWRIIQFPLVFLHVITLWAEKTIRKH